MLNADPNITNAMNKLPFDEAVLFNHKEAAVRTINMIKTIGGFVFILRKTFFVVAGITC